MDATRDTIVAIATPPGRGGIAVVRVSGGRAFAIVSHLAGGVSLEPRRATLATLALESDGDREVVRDEGILTAFAAPASYTGEDCVEVSVHGSPLLAERLVAAAVRAGARLARAGEFSLRAFLNGRLDLAQAEAVRDLVDATTPLQARMAFDQLHGTLSSRIAAIEAELFELAARLEASVDFPDEGYHFVQPGDVAGQLMEIDGKMAALLAEARPGRLVREGATVALVGRTNVGKSTVFNRLAGADRAIVTEVPGTTRDLLVERVSLGGVPVTLVDTAGVRGTSDPVEREGVARAERARHASDLAVVVLDGSTRLEEEDRRLLSEKGGGPRLIVKNKADLPPAWEVEDLGVARERVVSMSALSGQGIDDLLAALGDALGMDVRVPPDPPALSSLRHVDLLRQSKAAVFDLVERLGNADRNELPEEFVLAELQRCRTFLEEITGKRTTEDLLDEIFSKFCVGK